MTKAILVCRPRPEADRTAERLRSMGYAPLCAPLLTIEPTGAPLPMDLAAYDALVVTSRQAVAGLAGLQDKPAYAVGTGTAAALKKAGFRQVRCANGTAHALDTDIPAFLAADGLSETAHLLWPCAAQPAFDMQTALTAQNIGCTRWVVYTAKPANALSDTIAKRLANGTIEAVLLTSPRIASTFATLAQQVAPQTRLLCMSAAIRAALPPVLRGQADIAREPNEAALLSLLQTAGL